MRANGRASWMTGLPRNFWTALAVATAMTPVAWAADGPPSDGPKPDIVVAADGSGKFKTVQEALASIPRTNTERITVLVKKGVYKERISCPAPFVTLLGESRKDTRIETNATVFNVGGSDFILQNITLLNTGGDPEPHAVTVSSNSADRVVFLDADVLSTGADTVSLWKNDGRYYHARCNFRGSVDSVCPHGWCYAVDCKFFETRNDAVIWHDGHTNKDQRFVLKNCYFDGVEQGFQLARHHHDALFFLVDCTFSPRMIDRAIFRVIYPLDGGPPSPADIQNNQQHDPTNIWGERNYFFNCHREAPATAPAAADGKKTADYAWFKDNLTAYAPDLTADKITAKWTFAGSPNPWDPENKVGPTIKSIAAKGNQIAVTLSENVTVKGQPTLTLADNGTAKYAGGSGSTTLLFDTATPSAAAKSLDLAGGFVFGSQASAQPRNADLALPH